MDDLSSLHDSGRGRVKDALLLALLAFLVYNANLRLIATGDSLPARFLPFAELLPVLIWMLPPVVAALGRVGRVVFLVLVLFSAGVQAIGAFCYLGHSDGLFNQAPQTDLFGEIWRLRNVPFVLDPQYSGCAPGDLLELVQEEARSQPGSR
jgi:hypothetical protein